MKKSLKSQFSKTTWQLGIDICKANGIKPTIQNVYAAIMSYLR